MKAVQLRTRGGLEAIVVGDAPTPRPGAGEVMVRVHAAGITPTELLWEPTRTTRQGTPRPLPVIPGHEFSGEVAALGAGVTDLAVGMSVYGMSDWFTDGAQAEFCTAPAAWVVPIPRTLDHAAAAATPISALTAWQGLFVRCGLSAGQHVLIHGGAGAVGGFAVQLARWTGARVTATASAHNSDFVRGLGADEVLDYRTTRFEDVVAGADAVFDTVGGETLARSWGVLKPGGRLVTIAASEEGAADERTLGAFFIVEANRSQLAEVARLIDGGALRPVVDKVFALAEAPAGYRHKPRRGKAVLRAV
jgi:NADPH:quinone reductase-like Zn-dependent oxidoreductase